MVRPANPILTRSFFSLDSTSSAAILTRLKAIRHALATSTQPVIVTERSVLTDKHVFAAMLAESGEIDQLEMALYNSWYDAFAADLPIRGIIYVTTGVAVSHERIAQRGRAGEEAIGADYLAALSAQHEKWVDSTALPVLRLSTEPGSSMDACVAQVRDFIAQLSADAAGGKPRADGGASAMPGGGSPLKARCD